MSIEFERDVIDLDLDLVKDPDKLKQVVLNGELKLYENELELLDLSGLGMSLNKLNEFQQAFIFNYIDDEIFNTDNHKKTKGDLVNAFIMSFDNHEEITKTIWNKVEVPKYDFDGNLIDTEIKVSLISRTMYQRWKLRATKYWAEHRLQDYVIDYKKMLEGNLDRVEQIKEAIYNDALNENASESFRIANRKMALDAYGMKNIRVIQEVDFFNNGGKIMKSSIDEMSEPVYNIIDAELIDDD